MDHSLGPGPGDGTEPSWGVPGMEADVITIVIQVLTLAALGLGLWLSGRKLTAGFDAKFDKLDAKFDVKIDKLDAKFDAKIDKLDAKLSAKIEKLEAKLDAELKDVRSEMKDLRTEIKDVRTELTVRIDAVHKELVNTRVHLSDRVSRLEGAVLGAIAPEPARESA